MSEQIRAASIIVNGQPMVTVSGMEELKADRAALIMHVRHLRGHLQSVAGDEYTEATLNAMARMDGVAEIVEQEGKQP